MVVTNINALDFNKIYSYADYINWKFKERLELIKGRIFKMSPAPSRVHQEVSSTLHGFLWSYFKDNSCKLYSAPFDVRLYDAKKSSKSDKDIFTVVQPDLCVICDKSKLDSRGAIGAPDLIIEILSPGNTEKEMKYKYELYEEVGVKEYWIVEPNGKTVFRYVLQEGIYIGLAPLIKTDILTTKLFTDLKINLEEVFDFDE
ncbi:MAG: Uma2 family endonuclease [Flavobacteriales bacterium]|nr:Uma2 family endonuclease [Flavobacteriales bacterium]